jgi:hypothetical protein
MRNYLGLKGENIPILVAKNNTRYNGVNIKIGLQS